jgi:arginine/lysine/ornithine decarboxylase
MNNQLKAPLYEAILQHIEKEPISFHVPGHKSGLIFNQQATIFQPLLKMDLTELSGLDDLHSPEGPIMEAENLLADLYKAKKSFFLINGSTVGNLSMIMAVCRENDIVLVQRNCHKSILNALKLAKVNPVFLSPEYDQDWKVAGGVELQTVKDAINLYPKAKAIILTYPNYYGMIYEIQDIIQAAHAHEIPVLVDEAHGAHFAVGDPFPTSALDLGADIVVQSAHKTLPAMTMGSFLHFNSQYADLEKLTEYLHIFQSSSPSYPIMVSLDLARQYLAGYLKKDGCFLIDEINGFKDKLAHIPCIRVLDQKGDPLKLVIQTQCELSGFELQTRLEKKGIFTELADPHNILLVLPLLKDQQKFSFSKTAAAIKEALMGLSSRAIRHEYNLSDEKISFLEIPFQEMDKYEMKTISIEESLNRVCAEMITPYPPGIPLLIRGERISQEKLENLKKLIETGARFQQGASLEEGLIQVFGGLRE